MSTRLTMDHGRHGLDGSTRIASVNIRPIRLICRLCAVACAITLLTPSARGQQIVDQILTLVNDEPITRIDLLWSLAMDPEAPSPAGPVGSDLLSRKLDVMIDERIISQEGARVPTTEITPEDIDKKRSELIKSFKSEAEFRQRAGSVGLTTPKLDELLRQRILIDRFVDFRFRSFVLITEQEIKRFYDERVAPEIRRAGRIPPSLDEVKDGLSVRDSISATLKQRKINDDVERWLAQARQRADVVQLVEP